MTTRTPNRRPGFTLIEIMVVLAIIVVLLSLSLAAIFRTRLAWEKRATEVTVGKVGSALSQQWTASLDEARDQLRTNGIPAQLQTAAGDQRRAEVLFLKMWLKRDFPQSFAEAAGSASIPGVYSLPGKPTFQRLAASAAGSNLSPQDESAVCLFLAVSQARRGMNFVPQDAVGAAGVKRIPVGSTTMEVFVDSWGTPLAFCRWPVDNAELQEAPYAHLNPSNQALAIDPQDPEGRLNNWNTTQAQQIAIVLHRFPKPASGIKVTSVVPVVMSAGPDKQWGVDPTTMAVSNMNQAGDNIYSYRLRTATSRGE